MKALKSELAKKVLADHQARGQLRVFVASKSSRPDAAANGTPQQITVRDEGGIRIFKPVVVPKAA